MNGTNYRQWDASGAVGLIIGNEGKEFHHYLRRVWTKCLTIPMIGVFQSLNASVAASLLIYQGYTSRHPLENKMKQQLLIVDSLQYDCNRPELNHLKQTDRLPQARDELISMLTEYKKLRALILAWF